MPATELGAGRGPLRRRGVRIVGERRAGVAVAQGVRLGADVLEGPQRPGEGDHRLGRRVGAGQRLPTGLGHLPGLVLPGIPAFARPAELDLKDPAQLDGRPDEGIGGMVGGGCRRSSGC